MNKFITGIFLLVTFNCISQRSIDHVNWSFNKYSINLNDTWKLDVTPMIRLNNNFTTFQNACVDYMFKRPIGKGFSVGAMGRTWFIPDQKLRQFIWLDVVHQLSDLNIPLKIRQRLRYHGALDINDRIDGDFLRYQLLFKSDFKKSPIQPFVAFEPFYRVNKLNYFERFQIEIGIEWTANHNLKFIVFLQKEDLYNFDPLHVNFLWLTGFQYQFKNQVFKSAE